MKGNLHEMAIPDLIQQNCRDKKTARLKIRHSGQEAVLYFQDGNVVHADLEDKVGEEVIYEILQWNEGVFEADNDVRPPKKTIDRSWSGLLLEGARRLDESAGNAPQFESSDIIPDNEMEVNAMAQNYDNTLKEMGGEITGFVACTLTGVDGINLAAYTRSKVDPDTISAQMALLFKTVDTTVVTLAEKSGVAAETEDSLLTTENAYVLMRFLPGKQFFLGLIVDRKNGNLGNMRLISKVYCERLAKVLPR